MRGFELLTAHVGSVYHAERELERKGSLRERLGDCSSFESSTA